MGPTRRWIAPTGRGRRWWGLLWSLAERQVADDVFGEAMATVSEHPAVQDALAATTVALERLLAAARADGRLRLEATTLDLRLLFAATRAAAQLEAGAWRRMLELGIDALATGRLEPSLLPPDPGPRREGSLISPVRRHGDDTAWRQATETVDVTPN